MRAFVLGAGLGKRLRPLTDVLPKPLIPVWQRPLITHAFDHLCRLGVGEFVINTHHLPQTYLETFPGSVYQNADGLSCPLHFCHEPVLLETGGGLANVRENFQEAPFIVYNGDILTDLPLEKALEAHSRDASLVTLVLRSGGAVCNVAFDTRRGKVLDLRNALGTNHPHQVQFTGLYIVSPAFFEFLIPGKIESVVEGFLRALQAGKRIGGILIDEGNWWDLGDPASYLEAHAAYAKCHPVVARHVTSRIAPNADLDVLTCVSEHCVVAEDTHLRNTLLWPGARIGRGARLENCVVRAGAEVFGQHFGGIL
jgi:mannose-1-phosphate guanylyltransferase/mannose-1-phosphate guanylyltransferase/phosphomannomutase